ncbi:NAD(P)H-binding protein [Umezawaea tangerina]|uniref:NAD(P)H dehydrogenase (Quinone) n=1 Tax=Umezawaea tangerina TaxID=84725 RepID=A0A2T0T079_9PSEU|nr:NAD(P)H-binding protein [Umezawaea tangerina]PRY39023.1 NAD(P)H dehydrogenase (quinone) [Umezawaea tangerina]
MTIAITGASGALGRTTADLVLRTVDPREVVLTTRHPESLADLAARGVEVRRVDFADQGTLTTAFQGVDRLLLVSTDAIGARLGPQRAAIAAAAEAGVGHLVYTSVPDPVPANPALVVDDHAGTEWVLANAGPKWTVLRNNLYTHMQVPVVEQAIASGTFVTNGGVGTTAYVTREDCAAAAAAVLTQDGHEDRAYDVTGPEALSAADLADLAREIGGREVEVVHVDDTAFAAGLRAAGLPDGAVELVTSFGASTRGGFLATTSPVVSDLTGREPTAVADVLRAALA